MDLYHFRDSNLHYAPETCHDNNQTILGTDNEGNEFSKSTRLTINATGILRYSNVNNNTTFMRD